MTVTRVSSALTSQEVFVSKVTKVVQKTNKFTKKKRRAWHTEDSMVKELGWSRSGFFKIFQGSLMAPRGSSVFPVSEGLREEGCGFLQEKGERASGEVSRLHVFKCL